MIIEIMTLSSKQIRQGFIDFFRQRGHTFVPSSGVVPQNDPTLLFINAGMNQFKDIFLGGRKAPYSRAVNSQKCIRVSGKHNDLDEVGRDTYHHTFFEMLGSWSFGDYFKEDAITWAWQLFTDVWKFDKDKLWVSVFAGDDSDKLPADTDAEKLWKEKTGVLSDHVLRFGKKDNFWEMGDVGPCGPCSEIHLDLGPQRCDMQAVPGHQCRVNGDCARFIELWNLVFMQYNRDETGALHELPAKHVDTGAGLERIVAVLQNKASNYDTDLFMPIINRIAELTSQRYSGKLANDTDNAFRVIADHVRTLTFAIADGALPGNEGRGYILRRILRRAARFGLVLDMREAFMYKLVPTIVELMGDVYPQLRDRAQHVAHVIEAEEVSFGNTLQRGMDIFAAEVAGLRAAANDSQKAGGGQLSGQQAFRLYDTYGFPIDLTELLAREQGLGVDIAGFESLMEQQRQRARAAQKNVSYQADELAELLPETHDSDKYQGTVTTAKILGYVQDNRYISDGTVPSDTQVGLILDRTCAYAESGGQVSDKGIIKADSSEFIFEDARHVGPAVVHLGTITSGKLTVGANVSVHIDPVREDTKRNHTATHLLQWALRETLGEHVHQEGSLVCGEHLRFDFTCPKALTREQINKVEELVRDKITAALPVSFKVMAIDEARELGAMALFSEKYGQHVRVLAIGASHPDRLEEAFSREFCGGTHVANTGEIGAFKITREESIATGVRRITAMTGRRLNEMMYQRTDQIDALGAFLKVTPDKLFERIESLIEENKKLKKQLKTSAVGDLKSLAQQLLDNAQTVGSASVIVGSLPQASIESLRSQVDWLRKKAASSVIVLASAGDDGKVVLLAAVSDDLIKGGLKAGDIVKLIAPIVGGGGGGRPELAQAGGKDPSRIPDALKAANDFITEKLR